jgi:AraC-like DNA-binding protein
MKRIVKEVQSYRNYNESADVRVTKIDIEGNYPAGISLYKEAYNCSLFLKEAAFSYVIKGKKYMLVDKKEYYLEAGDLLYLPKNSIVFTDIPKTKDPFESFNVILSDELIHNICKLRQFNSSDLTRTSFVLSQHQSVVDEFNSFCHYPLAGANKRVAKAFKKLLFTILNLTEGRLFETNFSGKKVKTAEIQKLDDALLDYIYQPISLSQMAYRSNMSLATFKRKFKNVFGESPKTWIRNIRLQAAYFHLKTNEEMISEIYSFVGFENFSHFSYSFKKYFRVSPSTLLLKKLS